MSIPRSNPISIPGSSAAHAPNSVSEPLKVLAIPKRKTKNVLEQEKKSIDQGQSCPVKMKSFSEANLEKICKEMSNYQSRHLEAVFMCAMNPTTDSGCICRKKYVDLGQIIEHLEKEHR